MLLQGSRDPVRDPPPTSRRLLQARLLQPGVLHLFGADHTRLYPRGDLRCLRDLVCPTRGLLRPCLGPRLLFTHVLN
ncbi:hypothetical protein GW17_00054891 [Ensete ventricosum]|nr:hypothetical protein GW17_00054891 [Ensete ventricosum]